MDDDKLKDKFLTCDQASKFLKSKGVPVSVAALHAWRSNGRVQVPYYKFGRLVRYKTSELLEWAHSTKTTDIAREAK